MAAFSEVGVVSGLCDKADVRVAVDASNVLALSRGERALTGVSALSAERMFRFLVAAEKVSCDCWDGIAFAE
jgi:ABC-type lipopolysaccharide export system ATPase subunit